MSKSESRIVVQSVDGPWVWIALDADALATLEAARALIREDPRGLGLQGVVLRPPAGLVARYASALTTASVEGARVLSDPLNEEGPRWLPGYRVQRVHVFEAHFWLYATDASDPHHLPEVNRSDEVPFAALEDLTAPS